MYLSSSYNNLEETPSLWSPFSKLASPAHQLRSAGEQLSSAGPPVGRVVKAVSSGAAGTRSDPNTGRILGKFNFGVGTRGIGEVGGGGEGLRW